MRPLIALLLVAVAVVPVACGYSTQRLDAFPSARTIAVIPFQSPGFRRDLDLRLTQAVVDEIRSRTSYGLGAATSADLILSGVMTADETVTLQRADRQIVQKRLQGALDVTITDRRSGRVLKTYRAYDTVTFTPGRQGETLEGSAYTDWVGRVALRVVQGLEAGL